MTHMKGILLHTLKKKGLNCNLIRIVYKFNKNQSLFKVSTRNKYSMVLEYTLDHIVYAMIFTVSRSNEMKILSSVPKL